MRFLTTFGMTVAMSFRVKRRIQRILTAFGMTVGMSFRVKRRIQSTLLDTMRLQRITRSDNPSYNRPSM
ncbi:MAG: hypothetical protein OQJ83_00160, partial [Altibacter sp.]|nr:hypothetical protein [Altibacter sp.]